MMIVIRRQRKEQKTGGLCSGNGDENVRQTTNIVVLEESINHFFSLSLRLNRVSLHVTLIYSHLFHTLTRIIHSAPLSLFTTMQQYR